MVHSKLGSLTFNYSDVFFSYYFNNDQTCAHMVKDHMLVYVYSGELLVTDGCREMNICSCECAFLRKNHRVNMTRKSKGIEQFRAVFLVFNRKFLREFYQQIDKSKLPADAVNCDASFVKLPITPVFSGLFQSIVPYFDSAVKPSEELMQLKLREGIYALLNVDNRSSVALFDFIEPWKIDILDFMNENYMYDLSIEDIASFTGRSPATFKRDFKKISHLSPQKWMMQKRLIEANRRMQGGETVSNIYLEVGFKSLSHFSQAYKKHFGHSPTK